MFEIGAPTISIETPDFRTRLHKKINRSAFTDQTNIPFGLIRYELIFKLLELARVMGKKRMPSSRVTLGWEPTSEKSYYVIN